MSHVKQNTVSDKWQNPQISKPKTNNHGPFTFLIKKLHKRKGSIYTKKKKQRSTINFYTYWNPITIFFLTNKRLGNISSSDADNVRNKSHPQSQRRRVYHTQGTHRPSLELSFFLAWLGFTTYADVNSSQLHVLWRLLRDRYWG